MTDGQPRVQQVDPPELAKPSGFSHAVRTMGGVSVYLAGQTALDEYGTIVGGSMVAQFEQALGNLLTALHAAGGTPQDLTSLTIYMVDVDAYKHQAREIGAVWKRLIGHSYPAVAGIGVARLWDAEALVELQGTACITSE